MEKLKQAMLLSYEMDDDTPRTVTIDDQDYVVDDEEISVVWNDEPATTSAIYVRVNGIVFRKWSNSDGYDSLTMELAYSDAIDHPDQRLADFNERLTD